MVGAWLGGGVHRGLLSLYRIQYNLTWQIENHDGEQNKLKPHYK